jgi:hypothetical protein
MPIARSLVVSVLAGAVAVAAESGVGLPKQSPFASPAAAGAPTAANETIEFAGVSSVGKRTDLIFYDKSVKKSHWIAEGESKEGISVLKYDARREQAVVKVNGVEKTLSLRKGGGPVNAPAQPVAPMPVGFNNPTLHPSAAPAVAPAPALAAMPAPMPSATSPAAAPAKPEGPVTPETQQKQETEARMLVSDLLEIGMAQRRAYEEAQRKAAEGNAQPTAAQQQQAANQAQPAQPPR